MGMETLALNIDHIEQALEDAGFTTEYTANDGTTSYTIEDTKGQIIEVFDAVSGGYWRPEDTSEAVLYTSTGHENVTESFATITSEYGVIALVKGMFATV